MENVQDSLHWKLMDLASRDIYDGIYLVKEGKNLMVYSLLFEIDDPIPFSFDNTWSVQVTGRHKPHVITFSGNSYLTLYRISILLFKRDVEIEIFRNFHLFIEKDHSPLIRHSRKKMEIKELASIDPTNLYYLEFDEELGTILRYYNKKSNQDEIEKNPLRICKVNNESKFNFHDALDSIISIISKVNYIRADNNYISSSSSFPNCDTPKNEESRRALHIIKMTNKSASEFVEMFRNVIGKLFFESSFKLNISMDFLKKERVIFITFEAGVFSLSLREYFKTTLKECKMIDFDDDDNKKKESNDNNNKNSLYFKSKGIIRVDDHYGHSLSYNIIGPLQVYHFQVCSSPKSRAAFQNE